MEPLYNSRTRLQDFSSCALEAGFTGLPGPPSKSALLSDAHQSVLADSSVRLTCVVDPIALYPVQWVSVGRMLIPVGSGCQAGYLLELIRQIGHTTVP